MRGETAPKGGRSDRETHRMAKAAPVFHEGASCQLKEKQERVSAFRVRNEGILWEFFLG